MKLKVIFSITMLLMMTMNIAIASADSKDSAKTIKDKENLKTIILNRNDKENLKYEANKLLFMTSYDDDAKLLFSDSPETVEGDGILYQDTVKGDARLLYYHLNGTKENKKIAVVAENLTNKENEITITRKAVAGPSDDYLYVGKTTMQRYFSKQEPETVTIPPKGKTYLYAPDNERIVPAGGLVYGMFDFEAKRDLKLTVIMAPENVDLLEYVDEAPVQKKDLQRLRGTYDGKDRYLTNRNPFNPERTGKTYFYIGDNRTDLHKYGYDKTDNTATQNSGNYGVVYNFHPRLNGSGKTSFYLRPLGGVYAGAISVKVGKKGTPKMIETPDGLPFFGHEDNMKYYSYLGTYNNSDDIYFEYTPPGASNLPVVIILIPEK